MALDKLTLQAGDYAVFIILLVGSAAIGIVQGIIDNCKQKKNAENQKETKVEKRNLSVAPASLSVVGSALAAPFVLGLPAEIYAFGTEFSLIIFGYIAAVPLITHFLFTRLHKLEFMSIYEYLEFRYNKIVRLLCTFIFAGSIVFYIGIITYAPAVAFSQVTGVRMEIAIAGVGIVAIIYTSVGGLKGITLVDAVQMLFIFCSVLAIVIKGTMEVGGLSKVWNVATAGKRIQFGQLDPHPFVRHSLWTQLIGGCFTVLVIFSNQSLVQKFLSLPTLNKMYCTAYLSMMAMVCYLLLFCFAGLVMYAYFVNCSPLLTKQISTTDQLVPFFVLNIFQKLPGLSGLFLAAVFSASFSTIAGGLNALAAVTILDVIHPVYSRKAKDKVMNQTCTVILFKSLVIAYGVVTIGLAYVAPLLGASVLMLALNLLGVVGSPMLSLFIMGIFMPCVNSWGAGTGLLVSLGFMFWIAIGGISVEGKYKILASSVLPLTAAGCAATSTNFTSNSTETTYSAFTDAWTSTTFSALNATSAVHAARPSPSGIEELYMVSYMWYSLIGVVIGIVVGLIVSILSGSRRGSPVDPTLSFMCCYSTSPNSQNSIDLSTGGVNALSIVETPGKYRLSSTTSEVEKPPPYEGFHRSANGLAHTNPSFLQSTDTLDL